MIFYGFFVLVLTSSMCLAAKESIVTLDSIPSLSKYSLKESSKCFKDVVAAYVGATKHKMPWALKFVDAIGKPPAGLLQLDTNWPGDYSECIGINANYKWLGKTEDIHGKYCWTMFNVSALTNTRFEYAALTGKQQSLILHEGLCIPDSCTEEEISGALEILKDFFPVMVQNFITELADSTFKCIPKDLDWNARGIVGLVICSVFGLLIVTASFYDIFRKWLDKRRLAHQNDTDAINICEGSETETQGEKNENKSEILHKVEFVQPRGIFHKLVMSFSAYSNGLKILTVGPSSEGNLPCVHGIRFFSMSWVILGHTYFFAMSFYEKLAPLQNILEKFPYQAIINGGPFSVDSFFLLSGTLVSYVFLRHVDQLGSIKKVSWIKFYFHRFWRLTPAYMLILGLDQCLFRYFGSGPLWLYNGEDKNYCEDTWWTNLLYINNLVRTDKMCMGWSWYLANDMQFYIISPIFLVLFLVYPIVGMALIVVTLNASWITSAVLGYHYNFDPIKANGFTFGSSLGDYFKYFYIKPYTRIGPYLIGLVLGYILFKTKGKIRIPKVLVALGWSCAITINMLVTYGLYHAELNESEWKAYYVLSRSAWALGLAWLIFACSSGYGGPVNVFLSWKAFVPLSRMTYCVYLIHPLVMLYFFGTRHTLIEPSNSIMVPYFFAFMVASYGIGFALSLAFEAPMIGLEKIFLKKKN